MIHLQGARVCIALVACAVGMASVAVADDAKKYESTGESKKLTPMCPVMGEPAVFNLSMETDEGPIFVCCKGCIRRLKKEGDKYSAQIAEQRAVLAKLPKVQVRCPVTGKPVDGETTLLYHGREIQFFCDKCPPTFKKSPEKFKANLANSYTYQTKCPISGEPIDRTLSTTLATGETIYTCCGGCAKKIGADPVKYASILENMGIRLDVARLKGKSGGK